MNDPAWCNSKLNDLEDELASLGHAHRFFLENLKEVRLTWTDSGSKEVFNHFLDPHQIELSEAREKIFFQLSNLRDVVACMVNAESPINEIEQISGDSARIRGDVENEIQTIHHCIDRSLDEIARSEKYMEELISVLESI